MYCIYELFINHYLQDIFSHYLSKVLFVVIQNLWIDNICKSFSINITDGINPISLHEIGIIE